MLLLAKIVMVVKNVWIVFAIWVMNQRFPLLLIAKQSVVTVLSILEKSVMMVAWAVIPTVTVILHPATNLR
jgi:hypothetical protein